MSGVLSAGQATPRGGAYMFPFRRRSKVVESSGGDKRHHTGSSSTNLGEPLLPTVSEGRALESFDNDVVLPRRRAHTGDEADLLVVVLTVSYAALFIWAFAEVLTVHRSDCDQPLLPWVEVYVLITFITDPLQNGLEWIYCRLVRGGRPLAESDALPPLLVLFRSIISLFYPIWFGYGLHLISQTHTCYKTAPSLYVLVQCFVWVGLLVWTLAVVVLFTVPLTLCLVKTGWIEGPNAAKKGIINRIRLVPAGPNEGTCAICAKSMSYYGDEEGVTRTDLRTFFSDHNEDSSVPPTGGFVSGDAFLSPSDGQAVDSRYPMLRELICGHRFHRACLSRWLNASHTCPVCHLNLDRAYDLNYDVADLGRLTVRAMATQAAIVVIPKDRDFPQENESDILEAGYEAARFPKPVLPELRRIHELEPDRIPAVYRKLAEMAKADPSSVEMHFADWEAIMRYTIKNQHCLLPEEVTEIVACLAKSKVRNKELVQALNHRIRRTVQGLTSVEPMTEMVYAYQEMGWRAATTIRAFAKYCIMAVLEQDKQYVTYCKKCERQIPPAVLCPWYLYGTKAGVPIRQSFGPHDLTGFTCAFSRLHIQPKGCKAFESMWKDFATSQLPRLARQMNPRQLAATLNAFVQVDYRADNAFEIVARKAAAKLGIYNSEGSSSDNDWRPKDVALLINSYHKFRIRPLPLLAAVSDYTVANAKHFCSHSTALVVSALCQLDYNDSRVFAALTPFICREVRYYDAQEVAMVTHAYAKMGYREEVLFERLGSMFLRLIGEADGKALSMVCYGFARADVRHPALVKALNDEIIFRGTVGVRYPHLALKLESLRLIAWGMSKMAIEHDQRMYFVLYNMIKARVYEAVSNERLRERIELSKARRHARKQRLKEPKEGDRLPADAMLAKTDVSPNDLSAILAAYARSKMNMHGISQYFSNRLYHMVERTSTYNLGSIMVALAKFEHKDKRLVDKILKEVRARIAQCSCSTLSVMAMSLGMMKVYNRAFMRAATKQATLQLANFNETDLTNWFLCIGSLNYRDEIFARRLAQTAAHRLHANLSVGGVTMCIVNYQKLRIHDPTWFDAAYRMIFEKQHQISDPKLAPVLLYGIAITDVGKSNPWQEAAVHALLGVANQLRKDMSFASVVQLQIFDLWARLLAPKSIMEKMERDHQDLLARARSYNTATDDVMGQTSQLHRQVSKFFTMVGLRHRNEVIIGPYSIDILVGESFAFEVDGPHHFYRDTSMRTASSLLKHKILEALGFTVIRVPYQEWSQCGTREKRLRYVGSFWKQLIDAKVVTEEMPKDVALGDILEVAIADSQSVESAHDVIQRLARQLKDDNSTNNKPFIDDAIGQQPIQGNDIPLPSQSIDDEPLFYKVSEDADLDERMRIRDEAEKARMKIIKQFDGAESLMELQRSKGIRGSREVNYASDNITEEVEHDLFDRRKRSCPRKMRDHDGFQYNIDEDETDDDDDTVNTV
ncbi:hypothetical protein FOL47_009264 [Perkinsus chesapeaki]|uniref:RING-type domain-containing protein n=1 Tax=Perkinsus chesapeaki TaxID=330153 RepID=A0A7J6L9D0_PERCH|nr:hypothetical protein FOL47_009264 [Perkinsus chesapeaki]